MKMKNHAKDKFDDGTVFEPEEVHPFRDIPTKDINYFYFLSYMMDIADEDKGIISAYVLKWLKDDQIRIIQKEKGLLKKKNCNISFEKDLKTDNTNEKELYDMFVSASGENRILESKEFNQYCKKHYKKVINFFDDIIENEEYVLSKKGIEIENDWQKVLGLTVASGRHIFPAVLRKDMEHIYGLKKFLENQDNMKEKQAVEVHLWQEYLIYAAVFGIADTVTKQLKTVQPDLYNSDDINYSYFIAYNLIDDFVDSGIASANDAYKTANSGSSFSGGGGGSSFSGGGSSFSGGGGGGVR